MTEGSLGQCTASNGSLQLLLNNAVLGKPTSAIFTRKPCSKMLLSGSKDREKQFLLLVFCKFLGRRRVAMLLLVGLSLLVFTLGSYVVNKACPVCYLPVEQAMASMPSSSPESPVVQKLTYIHDENLVKTEMHGGSDFVGYPSLKQRNDSFGIKESMAVYCR